MFSLSHIQLPAVADVGSAVYQRVRLDRQRAERLHLAAVELGAATHLLKEPTDWTELHDYVEVLRATVARCRLVRRRTPAFSLDSL